MESRAQLAGECLFLRKQLVLCQERGTKARGPDRAERAALFLSRWQDWPSLLTVVTLDRLDDNRGKVGPVLFPVELLTALPTFVRHEDQTYLKELRLDWSRRIGLECGGLLARNQLPITCGA